MIKREVAVNRLQKTGIDVQQTEMILDMTIDHTDQTLSSDMGDKQ